MRLSDKRYGIVREVRSDGSILIGSYKSDKKHGLEIWFWSGEVWVRLYKKGKSLA